LRGAGEARQENLSDKLDTAFRKIWIDLKQRNFKLPQKTKTEEYQVMKVLKTFPEKCISAMSARALAPILLQTG
jgi:hypothetical protein